MIVSFDLDSTLADTQHRHGMIDRERGTDWEAYSMACENDAPGPAFPLARTYQALGARLVVCSARNECARDLTRKWLRGNGLHVETMVLYDKYAHGDDLARDAITHDVWKADQLLKLNQWCLKNWHEPIALHVDDWPVVKATVEAKAGIPVVIVDPLLGTGELA